MVEILLQQRVGKNRLNRCSAILNMQIKSGDFKKKNKTPLEHKDSF